MSPTVTATPPTVPNPVPGQTEPIGDQCPHCGTLKTFWLYNPFLTKSHTANGWVVWRTQHCRCPDLVRPATRRDPDLENLDRQLSWRLYRHMTFARFPQDAWRKALPAYRFCASYAGRDPQRQGVCLVGLPSPAREHLLAAILHALRFRGIPTALITFPHLQQLLSADHDREAWRPARAALRRVPQLAISGLFADPSTPVELKPIHHLLDERRRLGLTTHVSVHRQADYWRHLVAAGAPPIQAEIALLVEQVTLSPVAVPA